MVTFLALLLLALVLLALISISGICWYFSNRLLRRTSGVPSLSISVIAIDNASITLQRTKNTRRAGVFGIQGTRGQAIVGSILTSNDKIVTRELFSLTGELSQNEKVGWNTTVYGGQLRDSLRLPIHDVNIPGSDGRALPAWFVPGTSKTWAILVHGATGTQEQTLRTSKTLAGFGLNLLAISYRGDEGTLAGLSHLGDTEWKDLESAVRYALEQGAQNVVLAGWSLGGTIVETFLDRSVLANRVQAVVLDSPVLNWRETLKALTRKNKLPTFIANATEKVISLRTGVQFNDLDQTRQGKVQRQPTLLFHGEDDTTAPIHVSDMFASHQPNVTYHRIPTAEHTQCWNANPSAYEVQLRQWVTHVLEHVPAR